MGSKGSLKSPKVVAFSEAEASYLGDHFLGRVATASKDGQPHVVPVAYEFEGAFMTFGGWNLEKSLKFKNLVENDKVAIVVDDVVSEKPWRARGVEVRGRAEIDKSQDGVTTVRIIPLNIRSWGLRV
jgi:pyridoxamine 5'-phosphate oxidase family protein